MPSAIRQEELCGPAAGPRAQKPPAATAKGRCGRGKLNASCNDTIAFLMVACLVDQFDEAIPLIREIDRYHDEKARLREPFTFETD
jgi:hypothetical protein